MGFGHRVYRAEGSPARVLRAAAQRLGASRYESRSRFEQAALAELRSAARPGHRDQCGVLGRVILDFARVRPT